MGWLSARHPAPRLRTGGGMALIFSAHGQAIEPLPKPPYPRPLLKSRAAVIAHRALTRVSLRVPGAFEHLTGKELRVIQKTIAETIRDALTPAEQRPRAVSGTRRRGRPKAV